MSDDPVEWLRLQLDEDEQTAKAAIYDNTTGRWHVAEEAGFLHEAVTDETRVRLATGPRAVNAHIALHDPARVLRDVAAGRKLIAQYEAMRAGAEAAAGTILAGAAKVRLGAYEVAVKILAEVYFDRPGYQEAWRLG